MVQNVLNIVYKEIRGLHQAAYILALCTFGSQLLALIRDRLLAHEFGAGIELDLYYTAFRIPDLLYVVFASVLSIYVLVPFISKRLEGAGKESAQKLLSDVFSVFVFLYTIVALFAMMCAPIIVEYFFPGFVDEKETLVHLMRILLLQPLFLGISSLLGVITQIEHRFVLYATSPLVYNFFIILGLLILVPIMGISGITIGVVLGAFGHLLIQIPFILKSPLRPRLTLKINWQSIYDVFFLSLPRALALSLHQIVLLVLVGIASSMVVGSVSVFQFAFNLQSVPLAIIGTSYSVAAFPLLARLFAEGKMNIFGTSVTNALRHILFWSFPAIALFIVVRAQFVRVVLGSGNFNWNDTRLTAAALAIFIVSLTAHAFHLLLIRALYATGNTRTPLYVTLFSSGVILCVAPLLYMSIVANEGVQIFLRDLMRLHDVSGMEVLALPLAYSFGFILHATILIYVARKELCVPIKALIRPGLTSFVASIFGGYIAYRALNYFIVEYEPDTLLTIFAQGMLGGMVGIVGVVCVQYILRSRELAEIGGAFKRRFMKGDVAVPQNEDTLAV